VWNEPGGRIEVVFEYDPQGQPENAVVGSKMTSCQQASFVERLKWWLDDTWDYFSGLMFR
jgi:hypothetical protein